MKFIITAFMASILMFAGTSNASADDFDYTEVNTFVSKDNWTFGVREYADKDVSQRILRYDFEGNPYRIEYRKIDRAGVGEDWIRFQVKQIKNGSFFFNSRFEHRSREGRENVMRYRPQFGLEAQGQPNLLFGSPFLIFEPHVQYTYDGSNLDYSHLQTFIGTKYKFGSFSVSPFVEVDFDDDFKKDTAFFGVDFKLNL